VSLPRDHLAAVVGTALSAAAVVIAPEEEGNGNGGTLIQ